VPLEMKVKFGGRPSVQDTVVKWNSASLWAYVASVTSA